MTYQIFYEDLHPEDVEHARAYVQDVLDATYVPDRILAVARVLQALLPTPTLPTLADMTYQERAACQRMQCDVIGFRGKCILVSPSDRDGDAVLLGREGEVHYEDHAMVVPRPDLPRFVWPDDTPEAVPPNTLAVGSVWIGINALTRACEESGRDQIVVSDFGGYVSVWSHDAEWWEGSTPPRTTPYTIIHTGKEADQ